MRGVPPSPSWYGAGLACATGDGDVVYASDKCVVAVRGDTGAVRGTVGTKARVHATCAAEASTSTRDEGDEGRGWERVVVCACADKSVRVLDARAMVFRGKPMMGGHGHEASAACAYGRGRAATGCRGGAVAVWRLYADVGVLVSTHKSVDGPITCMAASGETIAVGGANGTVCALNPETGTSHRVAASGYGEITSLAWTRMRTSDGDVKRVLAVGSRERRVTLWSLEDGKLINTHALILPKPSASLSEAQRGRVWVAVSWVNARDDDVDDGGDGVARLVTSGQGGDLLFWQFPLAFGDGVKEIRDAKTFGPRHVAHTRTIFTISTGADVCWSTSLDRKVACWDLETREQRWSFNALGGYVYDLATDAEDPFAVAIACGDGTVHGWDLSPTISQEVTESLLWKGLPNTKVTAIARRPGTDVVAFGLEDGRVGCFDAASGKFACYPECHGASVKRVAWLDMRGEEEDEPAPALTSLGADGTLWRWMELFDPATCNTKKSGIADPRKYGKYLDMGKMCAVGDSGSGETIETFDYSPNRGRLLCGWSSGEISAHDLSEETWRCREHSKSTSCVLWHPSCDDTLSAYASWFASASTSGSVLLHEDKGVVTCALPRAAVYDLAWSPRKDTAILACALHGSVKVWQIQQVSSEVCPTILAVLRGHSGKVFTVKFAIHDDETILSGGDDKTFRVWKYTDEEHAPQEEVKDTDDDSKTVDQAPVVKTSPSKQPSSKPKKGKSSGIAGALFKPLPDENTTDGKQLGQASTLRLARRVYRGEEQPLTREELTYGPSGVALYDSSASAMALLMNEAEEALGDGSNSKSVHRSIALHMYRGDYAQAASIALKANEAPIPHEIMSLFIGGGYEVWSAVAKAQCDRLLIAGEIQQAAMLRLSLHDVPGAIATLRQGGLIRDAAALAAARLLPTDELLIETRRELAAAEETRGGMEAAAKAHLSIGAPASAVRALTRTTSGGALAAAKLALACNLTGPQERQTVARAAIELAQTDRLQDAVDLINELSDLCERERCSVDILATLSAAAAADEDVVGELARHLNLVKAS